MASLKSPLRQLCSLVFFFVAFASALKFDLAARGQHEHKPWRCIRNFVGRDTLVVVTATVSGYRGDGMIVNMHVSVPDRAEDDSCGTYADASGRSTMPSATSTASPRTWRASRGLSLHPWPTRRLMFASRMS